MLGRDVIFNPRILRFDSAFSFRPFKRRGLNEKKFKTRNRNFINAKKFFFQGFFVHQSRPPKPSGKEHDAVRSFTCLDQRRRSIRRYFIIIIVRDAG